MSQATEPVPVRTLDLSKTFEAGPSTVRAVDNVSLEIARGELVLIMGPSGSGKTTLLSMIGGLLRPTSGAVVIEGTDLRALADRELAGLRARRVGFVFQAFNLLANLTAEENVLFPAALVGVGMRKARDRARSLLARLGLDARRHFLPRDLSGGEKQRVSVARALINEPSIILADEPTGNLDSHHGQEVMMILHDVVRDEGRAVLVVTHDPRAEDVADRILWLEDGALRDRKREEHAWLRDPVCNMRIDEWTATAATEWRGRRWVFCSARCLARFRAQPERYAGAEARPGRRGGSRGITETDP